MHQQPSSEEISLIRHILLSWGKNAFREFPWRQPQKPWHGLVAEILLQRTRAENVVPVFERFIESFPEPVRLALATEDEIAEIVYPLGLHWRVPLLKKLGNALVESGDVPEDVDELMKLPGVGSYVAAAWMSLHAGKRGILIDSNVVRWVCRMIGVKCNAETRRRKWLREIMDKLTPAEEVQDFNYALLDFTMTICVPRVPKCDVCPFAQKQLCQYGNGVLEITPSPN